MSKVKLEVGMQVSCIVNGLGVIDKFSDSSNYPIVVKFKRGLLTYTEDGREVTSDANPTLKLLNIPFTEGLEVECDIYGKGKVIKLFERTDNYPVIVAFENAKDASYTLDGRIDILANQTLFPQFTI